MDQAITLGQGLGFVGIVLGVFIVGAILYGILLYMGSGWNH